MPKQDVNRNQDEQQSRGMQGSPRSVLMRRGGGNPFALTLSPFETFLTNPFSLMRRMSEEMDRAFAEFNGSNADITLWAPAIEVSQQDGHYVVQAELPGLKPEDVKVEARDGVLIIEGERKAEREEDRGRVHRTERRYGQFYRIVPLPDEANVEQAQAKFENGVLRVTVPVPQQQSNRRQIPVQGEASGSSKSGSTESSGSSESKPATSTGSSGSSGSSEKAA